MGKITTSAEIRRVVDSNLKTFLDQTTGPYARLFNKSPTFTEYFSQDLLASSADTNLGGVIEVLGPDSPLRFKKIEPFPIYGINEFDISSSYDEVQGVVTGNIEGEAYVLPGTIEPVENDMFIITYLKAKVVFRVRSVSSDRIEGNGYFKIQFFLDLTNAADLDGQTTGSYSFEVANVGTALSPIVSEEKKFLLAELSVLQSKIAEFYVNTLVDSSSSAAILPDYLSNDLYDPALNFFISKYNLLENQRYLQSTVIAQPEETYTGEYEYSDEYVLTIFHAVENSDSVLSEHSTKVLVVPRQENERGGRFFSKYAVRRLGRVIPVPAATPLALEEVIDIGSDLLVGDTGYTNSQYPLFQVATRILARSYGESADGIRRFIEDCNVTTIFKNRVHSYWLLPLVLFTIKRMNSAVQRTSD